MAAASDQMTVVKLQGYEIWWHLQGDTQKTYTVTRRDDYTAHSTTVAFLQGTPQYAGIFQSHINVVLLDPCTISDPWGQPTLVAERVIVLKSLKYPRHTDVKVGQFIAQEAASAEEACFKEHPNVMWLAEDAFKRMDQLFRKAHVQSDNTALLEALKMCAILP